MPSALPTGTPNEAAMDTYSTNGVNGVNGVNGNGVNGTHNGSVNGGTNGHSSHNHSNGHSNGHTNGHNNDHTNGHSNGPLNGHSNGHSDSLPAPGSPSPAEPVAVIGMSIRFPGDATSPEAFWDMLVEGRSAWSEIPSSRFNVDAWYHPNPDRIDAMNVRSGHFIKQDPGVFDAPFFSISQSEANSLDPDQRIILETSYHALESAGLPMESLAGTNTSVYMGTFTREYGTFWARDPMQLPKYAGTGTGPALLANRVSWFYDLRGTSITLDTACSSSMNALHLACESLRAGTTHTALVGGTNLILNPDSAIIPLTNLGFLSPDGRCYAFDHRANGYARGEGYAMLVLKRLADAVRDGDTIRAVVRATGANQDGRTPGISQPRAEAQATLIRETYAKAGLSLSETRFFEAHGTGTAVGDPIEASAIAKVFGPSRTVESPLYVGAVKSNIGHLEGASAMAGLVKAILALEHGVIPPNINLERVNPKIPVDEWHIAFPTEPIPWPKAGDSADSNGIAVRRASVSSFGYGGANAHVILDDAASYLAARGLKGKHRTLVTRRVQEVQEDQTSTNGSDTDETHNRLLVFSAADEDGIRRLSETYTSYLATYLSKPSATSPLTLSELAHTLCTKRSLLPWKAYVLAPSLTHLHNTLQTTGLPKPVRSSTAAASLSGTPGLAFVFTGQGAQWAAMGRELRAYRVFGDSLLQAEEYLKRELGCEWSVAEELYPEENSGEDSSSSDSKTRIDRPALAQCLTTVVQVALVELLRTWGIVPAAVVGHSSGEIAAAYAAGGLSRESAWKAAYYRGVLAGKLETTLQAEKGEGGSGSGWGMMAVGMSEAGVQEYLEKLDKTKGEVTVGCVNAPENVTVTGAAKGLAALQVALEEDGVFCRRLRVTLPYHSRQMEAVAEEYTAALQGIVSGLAATSNSEPGREQEKQPTMYSSVTGTAVSDLSSLSEPQYWVANLVSTVRFAEAAGALVAATGIERFVEAGPTAALKRPVQDVVKATGRSGATVPGKGAVAYHSVLYRDQDASVSALEMVGQLFCSGYPVDLAAVNSVSSSPSSLGGTGEGSEKEIGMAVGLPAYPFNHAKRYWEESRISRNLRFRKFPRHELLGTREADWNPLEPRWRNFLRVSESSWIVEHEFNGSPIYPASGMIVMAIEAARQIASPPPDTAISGFRIRDMTLKKALMVSTSAEGVETQLTLRPKKTTGTASHDVSVFTLYQLTGPGDEWTELCNGTVITEYSQPQSQQQQAEVEQPETALAHKAQELAFQTGAARCQKRVDTRQLYESLGGMGFKFGPAFQTLHDVRFSDEGEALATIRLREWEGKVKDNRVQPHVIHPAPLDGVFHLAIVASTKGGWNAVPTSVPTALEDLWISNDLFSSSPDTAMGVYTQRQFAGLRDEEYKMVAVDSLSGQPRIVVNGYRGTTISSSREGAAAGGDEVPDGEDPFRRICYEMHWQPDVALLSPAEIRDLCIHREMQKNTPEYQRAVHYAEILCLHHMREALTNNPDLTAPPDRPHLARYIAWMRHNLALPSSQARLASPEAVEFIAATPEQRTALLTAVTTAQSSPDGENNEKPTETGYDLYATVSAHFPGILSGTVDPLSLLFDADTQLVARFYQADFLAANYAQMAAYMDLLAHKDANMRVLEVGAGTGGATVGILETLARHGGDSQEREKGEGEKGAPRLAEYVYTDVSAAFFESARERFAPLVGGERLTFKTLDIEGDLAAQGFLESEDDQSQKYDVVAAANVLHATKDLGVTVRNVRRLLRDGGKLVLFEVTDLESARITFAFGTLPGWWLGSGGDGDGRQWGPLLSVEGWDRLLRECGFSGAEVVMGDAERGASFSVIVAEAVPLGTEEIPRGIQEQEREKAVGESEKEKLVIVVDEDQPLQLAVANSLAQTLETVTVPLSSLANHPLDRASCIFLPELTRSLLADVTPSEFETLRQLVCRASRILWVTLGGAESSDNPLSDLVVGFGRSMCSERPLELQFCTLALEGTHENNNAADTITKVFGKLSAQPVSAPFETYYLQRRGHVCVGRLVEAGYLNEHVRDQTTAQSPRPEPFSGVTDAVADTVTSTVTDIDKPTEKETKKQTDRALGLKIGSPGLLDTFYFAHDSIHDTPLAPGEVEVRVHASGLNFKDVMVAMGQLPFPTMGLECAGVITRLGPPPESTGNPNPTPIDTTGRYSTGFANGYSDLRIGARVACFVHNGSFKTYARATAALVAPIPDSLSFAEAATLPIAFLTAYHALVENARLEPGESVLIHAGAGGVGQAAVQLAFMLGAGEVFVTVSTEAKKKLLVDEYGVNPDNVFSSRKLSFAQGILRRTSGRGVDVVLNSLAGDVLRESWACVATMGRFVEIGKRDIIANEALAMGKFGKSTTFAALDLDLAARFRSGRVGGMLREIVRWVGEGKLRAQVPLHVYSVGEVENAFRGLQSGKLAGKVVVEMDNTIVPVVPRPKLPYQFDPHASYLLSGGLGGLGRSIARWMASRGARFLILLSRSGLASPAAQSLASELSQLGVRVAAPACDVSDPSALASALAYCSETEKFPPIRGCIQGAMVLRDSIIENMTHADYHAALRPKVAASWNLHAQLPQTPGSLDFFVLLSSLGGVIGNSGQSNYAAGNTYQDALARHRHARGLPASALDVGMMMQVGFVAEKAKIAESLIMAGYTAMYEAELLAILGFLCDPHQQQNSGLTTSSPLRSQILTGVTTQGVFRRKGFEEKNWMARPEFNYLRQLDSSTSSPSNSSSSNGDTQSINYATALPSLSSLSEATALVETGLIRKMSKALFIAEQDIDPALPVYAAGVDSLVAVELKYWFLKELHAEVAVFNILGGGTLRGLCGFAVGRSVYWRGEGGQLEGDQGGVVVEVK
ncbi:phenolpthiocerol synthesis polyketide synthase ppsA [Chaetomium sp. MPI-SDFR-AT-0129]|nr:phenolpthiocerol synthesis polyketide synthase ppsA [Chaetomium sp. MPI-SDFR-AT-0129]